jgi:hypothetical protein
VGRRAFASSVYSALARKDVRKRNAIQAQENGDHPHLDGIDKLKVQEAAKERPAAKEPDVFAGLRSEVGDRFCRLVGDDRDLRVVL